MLPWSLPLIIALTLADSSTFAFVLHTNARTVDIRKSSNVDDVDHISININVSINGNGNGNGNDSNIRLNKVFRETHSRRSADALIADGRVKINGETVHDMGRRVIAYADQVELDGQPYTGWEVRHGIPPPITTLQERNESNNKLEAVESDTRAGIQEEYIKYWKPVGVTSTTDRTVPGNLLEAIDEYSRHHHHLDHDRITQRIFSVGRLDKDSSGLLLLTSDGRIPNAVLRKEFKRPKVYFVSLNKPIQPQHVDRLRAGLLITTDTLRQGKHKDVTAPTLPCDVKVMDAYNLQITLTEGRNRQIRVMLKTVGDYAVVKLHRIQFMGVDLSRLSAPGQWTRLNEHEWQLLNEAVIQAHSQSIVES